MTLISIVTGTWNRLQPLQEMVASARLSLPSGIPYEFVIVDGGSTDGTVEWAQSQPDARLIPGDLTGAIKAFNTGAEAAWGKYVILANDDILFFPGSILRAVIHLEESPRCGAVAFADNRHYPQFKREPYAVSHMGVRGLPNNVGVYAQVGLFRRWLGNALNWWGYGEIDAKTYGGDNLLSARIWEAGYTVDAVDGARVHDTILEDDLRARGRTYEDTGYHQIYPDGPLVTSEPRLPNPDNEALRVLYLPVFENHKIQKAQKRGLRDALGRLGMCWEIDYYNVDDPIGTLRDALDIFKPQLIVTQVQGADKLTTEILQTCRDYNHALICNWNGDYWLHGLTSKETIHLLKNVDLQLTVNAAALPIYEAHHIPAAYWQCAWEPVPDVLPEVEHFDVVMTGNNNSLHQLRTEIEDLLEDLQRTHGITYGLFGDGWRTSQGNTLYDFARSRAIFAQAHIAISDTIDSPDNYGFVSDRLWSILAAGGAIALQQHVPGLDELTGLKAGVHYMSWRTLDELRELILTHLYEHPLLDAKPVREYALKHHSFDARVQQLLQLIQTHAKREIGGTVRLVNRRSTRGGGVLGPVTGRHYVYQPDVAFDVDSRDAEQLARYDIWERV